ncbi:sodium- and chloride-dependent neutral and basic amino acid transporter B(0+)-like, partial [Homarus americanus]|uniref:sodium- and chloride-dependent neutral and basic amino acid transporter B(0+)-like n=1 Tax=Homarus americanus TaxID=6706 RepID=UPI001C47D7CF
SHHSPAVGEEHKKKQDESETTTETVRSQTDEEEPLLAFGATNLLQHLFLALASPAFFRIPALAYKWSTPNGSGFFTAYAVLMLVVALPLCVLEQILAQFSSLGVITIFRCLPLLT